MRLLVSFGFLLGAPKTVHKNMVEILDFFDSGTDRGKKLLRYPKRWEPTAPINKLEKIGRAIAEKRASATSIQRRPRFEEKNSKLKSS